MRYSMTGKIIVSHLDNSFDCCTKYCIIFYPICQSSHNMIRLLVYPQENLWEDIYIYIYRSIKIMNGLVTAFLTNPDVNRSWISIPKLILLSRMLQQVLHLTKSCFLEEVGVEKLMVKRKKEVENNFSRESDDRRTSC